MMNEHILRRLDFALGSRRDRAVDPVPQDPGESANECRACNVPLESTAAPPFQWCPMCRHIYCSDAQRLLAVMPPHWEEDRFFTFWHRGMAGAKDAQDDRAFTQFFCDRLGIDFRHALCAVDAPRRDPIRIGRLALAHRLLSREEVAWALRFQRSSRVHRRRCFGEIAVALGFWEQHMNIRLLAVQAERRRGLVPAVAAAFKAPLARLLLAEKEFFGIGAEPHHESSGLDDLMAA